MITTVFGIALIASLASADNNIKNVVVKDNWGVVLDCSSGFGTCYGAKVYKLKSENGDPIRVLCSSSMETDRKCTQNVTFSDGVTTSSNCGENLEFQKIGQTDEMTITINGVGNLYNCQAKTISSPKSYTELTLSPQDRSQRITAPEGSNDSYDHAWRIKASKGSKIKMVCRAQLRDKVGNDCVRDVLTIDAGKGATKYCGKNKISVNAPEVVMRVEAITNWPNRATVTCEVKAIKA